MAISPAAAPSSPRPLAPDPVRASVQALERHLAPGDDTAVLLDFLEDDLREGLDAVADVEAHFTEILERLAEPRPSAIGLLEAADDFRTLQRLEYLFVVVSNLRRRLSQAAGRLEAPGATR